MDRIQRAMVFFVFLIAVHLLFHYFVGQGIETRLDVLEESAIVQARVDTATIDWVKSLHPDPNEVVYE